MAWEVESRSRHPRGNPPFPPYKPRRIRSHGVRALGGWDVKLYSVEGRQRPVPRQLLRASDSIALAALPTPPRTRARYGVSFVVVHEAEAFNTIVVDWWEELNELRHRVFRAQPTAPADFGEITASGESVCVWELRVQAFEREHWLRQVLENPAGADFDSYLSAGFDAVC